MCRGFADRELLAERREGKARERKSLLAFRTQPGIMALTSAGQLQKSPPATVTQQPDIRPSLSAKESRDRASTQ